MESKGEYDYNNRDAGPRRYRTDNILLKWAAELNGNGIQLTGRLLVTLQSCTPTQSQQNTVEQENRHLFRNRVL